MMQAMIRTSRRGLIAAGVGVVAIAVVAGLVVTSAIGSGSSSSGETSPRDNDAAVDLPTRTDRLPLISDQPPPVIDPGPATKPAEIPGTGGGSQPAVPPEAPADQPSTPVDRGNASSPVKDPKDTPVSATPVGSEPGTAQPPAGVAKLPVSNLTPLPAGTNRVEAPIDDLSIAVMDSYPPQYLLQIKAGLPSGCAQKAGYEAQRSGNTITVKVYNSMPQGAVACTMIYGMYDVNINLGSDYVPGQTYTVLVNDKQMTFKAQ